MAIPSFRAVALGIPLTDRIAVPVHGVRTLQSVWFAALPGLSLGLIGILAARWAFHQYRLPDPETTE